VHDPLAVQVDVPGVEPVAGQLAQPLAEAHLVEHFEAEGHQSFATEDALEIGLPLDQQHLGTAARQQERESGARRSGSDHCDPHVRILSDNSGRSTHSRRFISHQV
jgi:hypothetical protein